MLPCYTPPPRLPPSRGPHLCSLLARRVQGEAAVIKPDDEYPAWLWQTLDAPSLNELQAKKSAGELTLEETRRLWQLRRTKKIKDNNQMSDF